MKKWLVGLACVGMLAATAMGQATLPTSWSGPWTNSFLPTGWTQSGLGTDYATSYDGVGGGAAKFDTTGDILTINFDSAPGEVSYWLRANTLSGAYVFKVEESTDGASWTDVAAYNGSGIPTTAAPVTNVLKNASRYVRFNYVTKVAGNVGVDGVQITAGATDFLVTFDRTDGFLVPEGSATAITATALNGTEPYSFAWSSTLDSSYYATNDNMFNISSAAPVGAYTTTVVATDGAARSVTNAITFNVVPVYAITVTAPTNGTVTTDPPTQAIEGQTVTITATPDSGYRVASITVLDEGLNPVALTGNTFTMPASAVTVTVLFEVYVAPDTLIDFETVTGLSSYAPGTSTVSGVLMRHDGALRGTTTSDPKNGAASVRIRYLSTNAGYIATAEAFAQPISKISFLYADYGTDNTTTFKVQVSQDGVSWTDVGEAAYDPSGATLMEGVIDTIPANMTYVQFLTLTGDGDRVNIDDIGIWFGAATFNVTFDRTGGFAVTQGVSEAITATAANGTEPYGYSWSSTLGGSYYTAVDNVFTILATAPAGDYSATVVATDGTAASVTNSINFSVKTPYAITITTPTNGTVSTTPAGQAIEGTTVAITATPDASYLVSTITVLDETMTPAPVVGNTFVMPASPVTVTVEFVYHEPSVLIISEVADPSNNATGGRFVELYNAGVSSIDLTAGSWYLARQINGTTWGNIALTGTVAAGSTYVIAGSTNFATAYPTSPAPNHTSGTVDGNGDDGYFLFSGGNSVSGILEDAHGVIGQDGTGMAWEYTDRRAFRNNGVFQGNPTWTASEWTIPAVANTEDMTPGVHPEGAVVPSVSIVGDTTGTVGVQMNYTITLQNGTASSWAFVLKDPADADVIYNWDSGTGAFSFTPATAGTYFLSATALDAGALPIASNSVTPSVSAPADVDIPPVTLALNGTGNFLFTVPGGYSLGTVYGADTVVTGAALVFSNLTAGVHYTVSGSNVTITTVSGSRKIIRIGLTSP